jgi:FkbM family methyltransferase
MNIIQVGTNVANDDLTLILRENNIQPKILILIEPINIHNDKILNCYSHITNKVIENIAIRCDDITQHDFYYSEVDPDYTVASFNSQHIKTHGYEETGIKSFSVKCMTINKLFEKYNLSKIDILYIDAEGDDDCILRSIDYTKFDIKTIYYENLHLPYPQSNTHDFLRSHGYKVIPNTGLNDWSSLATKEK